MSGIGSRLRRSALASCLLTVGLLAAAEPAGAAVITRTFTFSATDFVPNPFSAGTPQASVTGSYTITWDPGVTAINQTTGIVQNSLNISLASAPAWTFAFGTMQIGGSASGTGSVVSAQADFAVSFNSAAGAATFGSLTYTQPPGLVGSFTSVTGTVDVVGVAEPGSLLLFGLATGTLGFLRRGRSAQVQDQAGRCNRPG